jgi:hypothetical protein
MERSLSFALPLPQSSKAEISKDTSEALQVVALAVHILGVKETTKDRIITLSVASAIHSR